MAQQSTAQTDRWGNPLPRKLTLKSGKIVTERFYDKSQYHQNCRTCGGDVFGQPIWYVRRDEAIVTPKHVTCPAAPTSHVETPRTVAAPAPKPQSVYAQRRENRYSQPRPERIDDPMYVEAGGLIWEVE